ncbi:deoxyhypusine synthase-like isoform X1 [Anneissia japonica]|uniref:deoxyhypusine synthase-like isoform X1 n=1 Tax=Anneissia japonica TaxID=1529436 RepID=UPI0014257AD1|nr:deoxyhypusine synthase-like isoform X1 [Anneissia japonica]
MADNDIIEYENDLSKYEEVPEDVRKFLKSEIRGNTPLNTVKVRGYDFNQGIDYHALFKSSLSTGLQATNFGRAVIEVNKMLDLKAKQLPEELVKEKTESNPCKRPFSNCTIFLSFTSSMISSGIREIIRFLVQHNLVDCIVTTCGAIEEDLMKCMESTYLGEFHLDGKKLKSEGLNRIGNMLIKNSSYMKLEDFLLPLFDTMLDLQKNNGMNWTPSKMIAKFGEKINHPDSVCYWAYKNNIPIFSPAIIDGGIGDVIYIHSYKNPGLRIDTAEDIRRMYSQALTAMNTGLIILGGGLIKHHVCNANIMRNGADYAVYINTAQEYDGSDSGARPDEAVSWGKISDRSNPVKIFGEASLIFPQLVAETFARRVTSDI